MKKRINCNKIIYITRKNFSKRDISFSRAQWKIQK